jgi:hypothetical protein
MKSRFYDATGAEVDAYEATDERGVIKHGYSVKTSLVMMDAADAADAAPLHRPGYAPLSDAALEARDKTIDTYNAWVSDAWRNPPPLLPTPLLPVPVLPVKTASRTADGGIDVYRDYDRHLEDAWRAA